MDSTCSGFRRLHPYVVTGGDNRDSDINERSIVLNNGVQLIPAEPHSDLRQADARFRSVWKHCRGVMHPQRNHRPLQAGQPNSRPRSMRSWTVWEKQVRISQKWQRQQAGWQQGDEIGRFPHDKRACNYGLSGTCYLRQTACDLDNKWLEHRKQTETQTVTHEKEAQSLMSLC